MRQQARPRFHQLVLGAAKDETDGCPGRAHVALGEQIEHSGNGLAAAEDIAPVLGKRTLVAYPPIEIEIERDPERADFRLTAPSVPGGRSPAGDLAMLARSVLLLGRVLDAVFARGPLPLLQDQLVAMARDPVQPAQRAAGPGRN